MEKTTVHFAESPRPRLLNWFKKISLHMQHISVEECLDHLTTLMYRLILLIGVPYFLFILFSFIRMTQ
ncbi:MAG: hypothetical protein ABF586_07035 [Sporolactobacillus sp.]